MKKLCKIRATWPTVLHSPLHRLDSFRLRGFKHLIKYDTSQLGLLSFYAFELFKRRGSSISSSAKIATSSITFERGCITFCCERKRDTHGAWASYPHKVHDAQFCCFSRWLFYLVVTVVICSLYTNISTGQPASTNRGMLQQPLDFLFIALLFRLSFFILRNDW